VLPGEPHDAPCVVLGVRVGLKPGQATSES
jgi:hypothetical protein